MLETCDKCKEPCLTERVICNPKMGWTYHLRCHDEMQRNKLTVFRVDTDEGTNGGLIVGEDGLAGAMENFDVDIDECAYIYPITMTEFDFATLPEFMGF